MCPLNPYSTPTWYRYPSSASVLMHPTPNRKNCDRRSLRSGVCVSRISSAMPVSTNAKAVFGAMTFPASRLRKSNSSTRASPPIR